MDIELELKLLRRLSAEYRHRALTEPEMARTLLEIAEEMEADAIKIEASEATLSFHDRSGSL